jgi:hypothetical protein
MAQENNSLLQTYLVGTVYLGSASTDLTTNMIRRLLELTGEMTARLKAMVVSAGGSN